MQNGSLPRMKKKKKTKQNKKKPTLPRNEAFTRTREHGRFRNISVVERATYTLISGSIADLNKFFLSGSSLVIIFSEETFS